MIAKSITSRIPGYDDNAILNLFRNALERAEKDPEDARAQEVLSAIGVEWAGRLGKYKSGQYKATTPKIGMLGELGYHVGQSGEPRRFRRRILDYVLVGQLPPVGSPAYVAEWGEPASAKRLRKIQNCLESFISSHCEREHFEKAVFEWHDDLEYIREQAQFGKTD